MFKLDLEKAEKPKIKLPASVGSSKKAREFQKNHYFCFIDYAKAFNCEYHNKLWKTLKEMGMPDHLTSLLRNLYVGQEETEPDMEQLIGSRSRKKQDRAVCCYPVCLTNMVSTS